jgi:hypothetical protein
VVEIQVSWSGHGNHEIAIKPRRNETNFHGREIKCTVQHMRVNKQMTNDRETKEQPFLMVNLFANKHQF